MTQATKDITKDLQIRALPAGTHKLTSGLLFKSNGAGAGSYLGRYSVGGNRVTMSLGVYPDLKLSDAKAQHMRNKLDARSGINPKRQEAEQVKANLTAGTTFADVLPLAHESLQRGWKNGGKGYGFMTKMEAIVLPAIGNMQIDEIGPMDLEAMAKPLWDDKYPTIDKALLFTGQVLEWAETKGMNADGGAARRARKLLKKTQYVQENQKSMPYADIPEFYASLGNSMSDLAFRLLILTVVRPENAASARYDQLEGDLWHLQPTDMKRKDHHWVPLSDEAQRVLELAEPKAQQQREVAGMPHTYLFPSRDSWKTGRVSSNDWTQQFRRDGVEATAHGFRASFKMWAELTTPYDNLMIEEVLHHKVRGDVEQAYIRGTLAELRRPLMQDWADFVTGKTDATPLTPEDLQRYRQRA